MKHIQKTLIAAALLVSAAAHAQNAQWQLQITNQPQPLQPAVPVQQGSYITTPVAVPPVAAPASPTIESIQAEQDARIRWGVQNGFITQPEYQRLANVQNIIEQNRRIAYADRYVTIEEQQFIYGQLNQLSADIDTMMLNGNNARTYYQQFGAPIPVWNININGWEVGRYEVRAEEHHRRGYRQPPRQQQREVQQAPVHVPAPRLRDILDPLHILR
jgi:hypothetical protein